MMNRSSETVSALGRVEEWRAELARKVAPLIGGLQKLATGIPELTLYRYTALTTQTCATYEPSIAVVVQGAKRVTLGARSLVYDQTRFLLTSVDLPVSSQVIEASEESPYLCVRLKLEMPTVRELLSREEIPPADAPGDMPSMTTAGTTVEMLSALCRLLDLLKSPRDIPFLSGSIQREIVYRVLQSPEGRRLRAIATIGDQSQRTAKAIHWLRSNFAKPLRVEDLAKLASMGLSTFHHHFRELTEMSPLQYQKQLRLQAARELMLFDGLDASSVSLEVGYESVSQFNREYSRYFGQPPMRDIKALRQSSGGAVVD